MKTISDYLNFILRSREKAKASNRLFEVLWEITDRCNLNCQHCYLPPQRRKNNAQELPWEAIKEIIGQLQHSGCLSIVLTGGEFFCREDASLILEYLKKKAFCLSLITNGTLLNKEIVQLLKDFTPLPNVSLSLYSLKEATNAKIVGAKGALEKTLNAIELISQAEIPLTINHLVMRNNLQEFAALKAFARERKVRFLSNYIVEPCLDGSTGVLEQQIPVSRLKLFVQREKKEEGSCLRTDACAQEKKNAVLKKRLFYCDAGRVSMSINPSGKANLCLKLPIPGLEVLKEGVLSCWQRIVEYVNNLKTSREYQCDKCQFVDLCAWCPAMGQLLEGDLNSCVPFYKKIARMQKEVLCA
jgi:radical SAM protein with 4Fe4S-binding SPASM domain